ncbi:hypothetical protein BJX66DRAFT_49669 [Aspergillus keveii]|uniref:Uncharacterized protein n=1 Tax=Aspergillus keveii TaxID=714993 RepID=A0ABR4FRA9_9EURO
MDLAGEFRFECPGKLAYPGAGRYFASPAASYAGIASAFRFARRQRKTMRPMRRRAPTATPMPIPAFAPVDRPESLSGVEVGVGVGEGVFVAVDVVLVLVVVVDVVDVVDVVVVLDSGGTIMLNCALEISCPPVPFQIAPEGRKRKDQSGDAFTIASVRSTFQLYANVDVTSIAAVQLLVSTLTSPKDTPLPSPHR